MVLNLASSASQSALPRSDEVAAEGTGSTDGTVDELRSRQAVRTREVDAMLPRLTITTKRTGGVCAQLGRPHQTLPVCEHTNGAHTCYVLLDSCNMYMYRGMFGRSIG